MTWKVNPVFRDHLPPLPQDVYDNLERSIIANGCIVPIVVWGETIVDGHNRFEICQKHNIPFEVREEHFNNEEEALLWITVQQVNRRNLTPIQRVIQALKDKPALIKIGRSKQGFRSDLQHLGADEDSEKHNTRKIIAKMAGVSSWTVYAVEYVIKHGDDSLKNQVLSGELSLSTAISYIRGLEWKAESERMDKESNLAEANKQRAQNGKNVAFPSQQYESYNDDYAVGSRLDVKGACERTENEHRESIVHERRQESSDRQFQSRGTPNDTVCGYEAPCEQVFFNPGPSVHDIDYIKGKLREECGDYLEYMIDCFHDIRDEDRTVENLDEIRDTVNECFNKVLKHLDNCFANLPQAN